MGVRPAGAIARNRLGIGFGLVLALVAALAAPTASAASRDATPQGVGDQKTVGVFSGDLGQLECKHITPFDIGGCRVVVYGYSGETTTLTVWTDQTKSKQLFTTTTVPTQDRWAVDTGPLVTGNHVLVTSNAKTLQYTVSSVTASVNSQTEVVTGTLPTGGRADVWVVPEEVFQAGTGDLTDYCGRIGFPDASGGWFVDFSVAADPANTDLCQKPGAATTYDFGPGDMVLVFDAFSSTASCDTCITNTIARVVDFTDDDGSVFEPDITWLAESGITKGCNPPANTEYCPSDPVTRAQMAAFLVRALGYTDAGDGNLFTDDDGSVFEDAIDKLGTAGVTRGCNPPTNDLFCPNDNVTRAQMAAFLVRALGYTDAGDGNLFTDDDGSVFEDAIDKLGTAGITRGCNPPTNDLYCPDSVVTREQMAAFLHRALG
ncbi:MAG: S-layer homology domain-containing protein [Actinomycetota bacterium]|nr:S-layer homology domain-containing protein [Actinomycetota bacterium]